MQISRVVNWTLIFAFLLMSVVCPAYGFSEHVNVRLIANVKDVQPGKPFKLGVQLKMSDGWHTYYKDSGDAGMPTKIEWVLPSGFKVGTLEWEKPKRFNDSGIVTYGYDDSTLIATTVTPPAVLSSAKNISFTAKVKWLECKDVCVPGKKDVSLSLPVIANGESIPSDNTQEFAKTGYQPTINILNEDLHVNGDSGAHKGLWLYLLFAFIGGLILNVMPCVLPVISIKVLSFIQQAGEDSQRVLKLGLTFSAGIIASFMALAATVIAIQATGQHVGWGFQFQVPGFLIAMSALVLVFALSLFGLFYFSISLGQQQIDKLASSEGYIGTFFKGVLATILATPCTAPFLGTSLGFAFAQPWWTILSVFFVVGLGMSFPYLVLTANPNWMRFLPKPGEWMEKFKESMGFLLLATVVWLLWILGRQLGVEGVINTVAFLLMVAFAIWLIGRLADLRASATKKYIVWIVALLITTIGYFSFIKPILQPGGIVTSSNEAITNVASSTGNANTNNANTSNATNGNATSGNANTSNANTGNDPNQGVDWQPFTIDALNSAAAANKTILVDFTADWCLTCKVNEQTVLNSRPVIDKLKALHAVTLKADWTKQDATITSLLQKFGRSGVPLYVIFPAGSATSPIVLPEVITQSLMLDKLNQAGPSKS